VFDFLGNANVFEGKIENGKWHNQQANIVLPDSIGQKSVGQNSAEKKSGSAVHSLA